MVLAPLLLVSMAVPAIIVVTLLLVAWLMGPAVVARVAGRRFAALTRSDAAPGWWAALGWSLMCTASALAALVLSVPLWFVPPLVLLLPPLIWGWLTYRVMAYDMLADHASAEERHTLLVRHRGALFGIGVLTGYLGAAPSLLWASGVLFVAMAPVLLPAAIWIYTLVFAFSALWFGHYLLAALATLREEPAPPIEPPPEPPASQPPRLLGADA